MKQNYYIDVFDELSNGEWKKNETLQTRNADWLVVKDGVLYSCGHIAATNAEEAKARNSGRYFQIAKSEPILDYVIGTFDICHFNVKNKMFETRFVVRVQLVNTREPYYFIQKDGKDWHFCEDICNGKTMQDLRKGMEKYIKRNYLKGGIYTFQNEEEKQKFEKLF